ncbi:MAG: pyruvate carboxylase subunit B, partial [Chthoniobacterales bacterium]|nr:pyruvate carboxylase subunit B [Chthoniobacterales bacterium]
CLRYLGEQPYERVRALRKAAPKTPQSMLLRGQNLVQYTCFPDDVVELFVQTSVKAGIRIFRIFDALNDARNLASAIRAVRQAGGEARGELCYSVSPAHNVDSFVKFSCQLKELGCHSIGIKDMAGILTPHVAAELVMRIQKETGLSVTVHSHDTAGLAASTYLAAIDAGAYAVETSIAPFADGSAQPDTLRMLHLLEGHKRAPHFDRKLLGEVREALTVVYNELAQFTSPNNKVVDCDTLIHQVPGGMISNFRVQLRELKMDGRIQEVLEEIPQVRKALGWPPLVTPISQIVGTQAMLNVKFGRWKNFSPAAMDIALGYYGKTPAEPDGEVLRLAERISHKGRVTEPPAARLKPRVPALRAELQSKQLPSDDESVCLYALFPREFEALCISFKAKGQEKTTPSAAEVPAERETSAEFLPLLPNQKRLVLEINGLRKSYIVEEVEE